MEEHHVSQCLKMPMWRKFSLSCSEVQSILLTQALAYGYSVIRTQMLVPIRRLLIHWKPMPQMMNLKKQNISGVDKKAILISYFRNNKWLSETSWHLPNGH